MSRGQCSAALIAAVLGLGCAKGGEAVGPGGDVPSSGMGGHGSPIAGAGGSGGGASGLTGSGMGQGGAGRGGSGGASGRASGGASGGSGSSGAGAGGAAGSGGTTGGSGGSAGAGSGGSSGAGGSGGSGGTIAGGGGSGGGGAGGAGGATGQAPDDDCDMATFENATYWFCSDGLEWDEARMACQAVGGDLVSVNSEAELAFLDDETSALSEWLIGLNQKNASGASADGTWAWVDGTDLGTLDAWDSGEPDSAECGELRGGQFRDISCTNSENWICEVQ